MSVQAAAWLGLAPADPFGLAALPYCSYTTRRHAASHRVGVRVGDRVLDLTTASERLLPGREVLFRDGTLDPFLAAGDGAWAELRAELTAWLSQDHFREAIEDLLVPVADAELRLPFTAADYVDFYASEHHAANVGRIFRPGQAEPLAPNWRHMPVGYHGRAGSVVVSGTPVRRPCGQLRGTREGGPVYGPTERLDFEAELGFVVGVETVLGEPVAATRFAEHVFGVCLVNDWSARDIQAWESAPLGPFLAKSFGTTISPWILPLAALEHARLRPPSRDTRLAGYLTESADWGLDIDFEVLVNEQPVARPPYRQMHWSPAQMLAHLTINGAALRTGDLYASGTVSGPEREQRGCLLELTWNGTEPITLPDGSKRAWLADSDEVTITATAAGPDGTRIGLGEARGQILPAIPEQVL
ncbi:MAG TPA: fumarylacetoacetase [Streptosporangiaceae bacterium]|jgi:fumarylacetoacetase|nr:fumarylacetoacetase [Streptosporangiaceae bacterium]